MTTLRKCVALSVLYEDAGSLANPTQSFVAQKQVDKGYYQHTGTNWIRIWADWLHIQPASPNQINTTLLQALDQNINAAKIAGLGVILVSRSYPLWCNGTAGLVVNGGVIAGDTINEAAGWNTADGSAPACADALEADLPGISTAPNPVDPLRFRFPIAGAEVCTGGAGGGTPLDYEWDLGVGSAWYDWILFLATRYNPTRGLKLPSSSPYASVPGLPPVPALASINCLEFVNEPLGSAGWPQLGADGTITTGSVAAVSQMFDTAYHIREVDLERARGPLMLGPASEDRWQKSTVSGTSTQDFTYSLLGALISSGFDMAADNFVWTHHNYNDFTHLVVDPPSESDLAGPTPIAVAGGVNSAALVRAMLVKYGWQGYVDSQNDGPAPRLWLTEGGVDMNGLPSKFHSSESVLQAEQAVRLQYMWDVMQRENKKAGDAFIGTGISMFTNWLFDQDVPAIPDTGLRNPVVVTGSGDSDGGARPSYNTWHGLSTTKSDAALPAKPS